MMRNRLHQSIYLLLLIPLVHSAGVTVHLTLASLTHRYLPLELQKQDSYFSAYLSGAFFPDAYYNCFGLSDEAEEAHWPPFLQAAVTYYHEEYLKKSLVNNELKAFLYGVFTHQVADVSWHSLKSRQGLLEMLRYLEFNGDVDKAHTFLDPAGDFIVLNKQLKNLSRERLRKLISLYQHDWVYPSDDLIQIYHRLGYDSITHSNLDICISMGYTALQGELTASLMPASPKVNYYLNESPMTKEVLLDYFYGGINEILSEITLCISQLDNWFENGLESPPIDLCSLSKRYSIASDINSIEVTNNITNVNMQVKEVENGLFLSTGIPNSQFGFSIEIGNFLNGELSIAIGAPSEDNVGAVYLLPLKEILTVTTPQSTSVATLKHFPMQWFSRFSYSMTSLTLSHIQVLVVSEPGSSRLKVFLSGRLLAIITHNKASSKLGRSGIKQFGTLLKSIKSKNGEYDNLLVGSHYSDSVTGNPQSGSALMLSGKILFQRILTSKDDLLLLDIADLKIINFELPFENRLSLDYEQFGTTIEESQRFIFIGTGKAAEVLIFNKFTGEYITTLKSPKQEGQKSSNSDQSQADQQILKSTKDENVITPKNSNLFGFHSIISGTIHESSTDWLLVSAAYETTTTGTATRCNQCGSVYLYEYLNDEIKYKTVAQIIPSHVTSSDFTNFGLKMVKLSVDEVLISGDGGFEGRGAIWKLNVKEALYKAKSKVASDKLLAVLTIEDSSIVAIGKEGVGYSGFGRSLSVFEFEKRLYLAAGMPYLGYGYLDDDLGVFTGALGIYRML